MDPGPGREGRVATKTQTGIAVFAALRAFASRGKRRNPPTSIIPQKVIQLRDNLLFDAQWDVLKLSQRWFIAKTSLSLAKTQ